MRVKVIRNYFEEYNKLLQYQELFKIEKDGWLEEMMLCYNYHFIVLEDIYMTEELSYVLQYQFYLKGRYKYNLTYDEIKFHSTVENKNIPVHVYVTMDQFKEIMLKYMTEFPNECPDKNKFVLNGITFKLFLNDTTI